MSLEIIKFVEYKENLQRGDVIRCPGSYPYEDYVDFMLIEYPCNQTREYALLVNSGYKAGLIFVVFPEQANNPQGSGVDIDWLKAHWSQWGYIDCPLSDVHIVFRKAPESIHDFY